MGFYDGLLSPVVGDFRGFDFVQAADKARLGIGAHQAVRAHYEADNIDII